MVQKCVKSDIFWIVCDEYRCDGIGAYGNPWIQTPNLDQLAAEGVLFTRAFCQTPACVASRASFLSGQYSHKTGNMWFDKTSEKVKYFPEYMHQGGYKTVVLGKQHDNRPLSAFSEAPYRHDEGSGKMAEGTVTKLAPDYQPMEEVLKILHRYTTPNKPLIIGGTNPLPPEKAETAVLIDHTLAYLQDYDFSAPLLMHVSGIFPHTPVLPPQPFDKMYDPAKMVFPHDGLPSVGRSDFEVEILSAYGTVAGMKREDIQRMRASYYGLCSYVDQQLGRLTNFLKTYWPRQYVIVFHTDHGTLLGEHGLHEKFSMYENALRVPLIIAGEGIPSGLCMGRFAELVDIAPTLMHLGGIEITEDMDLQGRDLLPLLHNPNISWRDCAFSESNFIHAGDLQGLPAFKQIMVTEIDGVEGIEFEHFEAIAHESGLDVASLEKAGPPLQYWRPVFKHIRTEDYSMTVRALWLEGQGSDWMGTLYDLKQDAYENCNVFEDPAFKDVREALIDRLMLWDQTTN